MNEAIAAIDEPRLINRMGWRLMPLLGVLYLVAYIDRSNIAFAKLQMLGSLGLSEVAYGLGASLFFIGYLLFEVPSNILLHKYGAPRWMARIMFTWGVVTILLAFTKSATMFYILRFLLGAAEAGLFPGVIYYLTLWFPQRHRVRMLGYFTVGSSLGNMIGAPICGWLLDKGGLLGLQGWQLVFVVTGIPSVLLTIVVLLLLPKSPQQARFLSDDEKRWLTHKLSTESSAARGQARHGSFLSVLVATIGATYSNIQFLHLGDTAESGVKPSGYSGSVHFNNAEINLQYRFTPAFTVTAAYDYMKSGGVASAGGENSGATYHQGALSADYALSKRTDLYLIGVYQHASGTDSRNRPAVAAINGLTASTSDSQTTVDVGIRHRF